MELGPQTQQPDLRRCSRTPVPRQVLHLHTTEEAYERIEHSLLTGSKLGNIATSRPGEVGYMPSVPANYNEAMSGPDAERWKERMRDEAQSLIDHDVFDCIAPPEGVNQIPTTFIHKWEYNQEGIPILPKSRVVVQGFYEADTRTDKAASVASMESVHLLIAIAGQHSLVLKQADICLLYTSPSPRD